MPLSLDSVHEKPGLTEYDVLAINKLYKCRNILRKNLAPRMGPPRHATSYQSRTPF